MMTSHASVSRATLTTIFSVVATGWRHHLVIMVATSSLTAVGVVKVKRWWRQIVYWCWRLLGIPISLLLGRKDEKFEVVEVVEDNEKLQSKLEGEKMVKN